MILIVGGGIGGLTTALALQAANIPCQVFEQSTEIRELGVGINTLPHAIRELATLGLLPALDATGIRTRELILANRFGQPVWTELRGTHAGHDAPQFSIHRGKLLGVLHTAAQSRNIPIHPAHRLQSFTQDDQTVTAHFTNGHTAQGTALIGADGIHSTIRATHNPTEGPPSWTGIMLWRGAVQWPTFADGQTMLVAGGMRAKFVLYPIHHDPAHPTTRLTNWAVAARIGDGTTPPPRREDWNRPGTQADLLPLIQDNFQLDRLGLVDPQALIQATPTFYEYPMCDRNPLPTWTHNRITLLGDAAHPMYPVGSNGASQAIIDATTLAHHLATTPHTPTALKTYEAERRPPTTKLTHLNRTGGPERVIDILEERAPFGFSNLDAVAPHAEREAIVHGYAATAGFARD